MPKKIRTRTKAAAEQCPPGRSQAGLGSYELGWYLIYAVTKLMTHHAPKIIVTRSPRKLTMSVEGYL